MKFKTLLQFAFFIAIAGNCLADSTDVSRALDDLQFKVQRLENNQLNYQIEKDLLRETYSNNYEQISLVITIVLGIIGLLGYLGLRDISTIKKEYEKELADLRKIQAQFEQKSNELKENKEHLDSELTSIIKENEEQSRKIKFIELKDKVRSNFKDNNFTTALEFASAALEINDQDGELLCDRGRILCRFGEFSEALEMFKKAYELNPLDSTHILNYAEGLYFTKDIDEGRKIVHDNRTVFEKREDGRVLELFELIEAYVSSDIEELKRIVFSNIDLDSMDQCRKKMPTWDLNEAQFFAYYEKDSEGKNYIQNLIWFWDSQIDGNELFERLNLTPPEQVNQDSNQN